MPISDASSTELEALAILADTPCLGPVKILLLIRYFGSALEALDATPDQLTELPGFGPKILAAWTDGQKEKRRERNRELVRAHQAQLIPYTSPLYPRRLLELHDHPILLYVKGELKPADGNAIAVVGTRLPTIYGLEIAEKIGTDLARMGYTVVSGLARGIDTAAHRGALKTGRTLAVLGSGLANIYPRENEPLSTCICRQGAVISEFSMAAPPDRQNFPLRNRIVSGMTSGTLLIEAPGHSGAMITMEQAYTRKRKTFALPGRADIDNFRGNHALIKSGRAVLVENAEDIARHFETLLPLPRQKQEPSILLEKEEIALLNYFPIEELTIEEIHQRAKLPIAKLNVLLMSLIVKKAIKEFPGKIFKKLECQWVSR